MQYLGKEVNGYKCYQFTKGIAHFTKKENKGYSVISCSEKQLHNGDIEFMTLHGLTLSKSKQLKIEKKSCSI